MTLVSLQTLHDKLSSTHVTSDAMSVVFDHSWSVHDIIDLLDVGV